MVMMSSMNTSIDASVDVMSTDQGSDVEIGLVDCCLSFCGIKEQCCEFSSSLSQDLSWSRFFTSSIAASLIVVYYAAAGVFSKVNHRQIKASLSTIYMHVDTVVAFACIRR